MYFNLKELASYLKTSKSSIYKWCGNGEIPHIKTKRALLFKKDEIDNWLNQFSMPSKDQIENSIPKFLKPSRNGDSL